MDQRYRDPAWVTAEIKRENDARGAVVYSARFGLPVGRAADMAPKFTAIGASGAREDGASGQLVVEFRPELTTDIATLAVTLGVILFQRLPTVP